MQPYTPSVSTPQPPRKSANALVKNGLDKMPKAVKTTVRQTEENPNRQQAQANAQKEATKPIPETKPRPTNPADVKQRLELAYEEWRLTLHNQIVEVVKAQAMLDWVVDREYTLLEKGEKKTLEKCQAKLTKLYEKMDKRKLNKWIQDD
ncbi:hypothetical protein Pmani_032686 [Petrolisthes manimaculis]|uniref:Uncharacterized protein n=1 Tax=Petrolisthes manimaculis TaxID=1843537 RepID=A0AAE1NR83_9EUCA|nr:hypothetical protein Pmani_032686 [Petrolisthes manimaculis]